MPVESVISRSVLSSRNRRIEIIGPDGQPQLKYPIRRDSQSYRCDMGKFYRLYDQWRNSAPSLPYLREEQINRFKASKTILFVEGNDTMYMPTPGLGVDRLSTIALEFGWRPLSAIVNYGPFGEIHKMRLSKWEKHGVEDETNPGTSLRNIIKRYNPSIVGLSAMSKGFPTLRRIIRESAQESWFSINKERLVIAGGVHPTKAGKEIMEHDQGETFNMVFQGNSLLSFMILLQAIGDKCYDKLFSIPGTISTSGFWRRPFYLSPDSSWKPPLITNSPDQYLSPRASKEVFENTPLPPARYTRLTQWGAKYIFRIQTAEGCIFPCGFCAVPNSGGVPNISGGDNRLLKPLSAKMFEEYLRTLSKEIRRQGLKVEEVLLYLEDGNAGSLFPKGYAWEHYKSIYEVAAKFGFPLGIQIRFDNLHPQMMELMKRVPIKYAFLSIESVDKAQLAILNKKQEGPSLKETYSIFKQLNEMGVETIISFMGMSDIDSVRATASFASLLGGLYLANETYKVYPGTKDASAIDSRLVHIDGKKRSYIGNNQTIAEIYTKGSGLYGPYLTRGTRANGLSREDHDALLMMSFEDAKASTAAVDALLVDGSGRTNTFVDKDGEIVTFPPLGSTKYQRTGDAPGFYVAVAA